MAAFGRSIAIRWTTSATVPAPSPSGTSSATLCNPDLSRPLTTRPELSIRHRCAVHANLYNMDAASSTLLARLAIGWLAFARGLDAELLDAVRAVPLALRRAVEAGTAWQLSVRCERR